ncbi:FCD domain-containing protein [Ramlibacter ginsenosidimutans]|uniref:FCD domain-containing protein n=1 Tax=Ramlibacter ginsenosidimutans TaxID=502333 RepID=A0A934WN13_9BURK|nr:FCD domain-containing protein [Ramlibacter ginsenosidimutans]
MPPIQTSEGLSRQIADQLRELIYAGEFKPGDRLNEAALAVRMGTSRGPIREAIRILTGTGLVTPVVNRGVFVRKISVQEMLEIYDLRALAFGFAAARACEHVTDEDRRRLEALLEAMDRAAQSGDSGGYYELNVRFHEEVLLLAHHERVRQLYEGYVKELHLYRRQNFNAPGNMRRSNVEHRRLYEAIAKGNAAKAKQFAEEHIQAGRARLLALADS